MKEWNTEFNSFNSWKGAFYFPWYEHIKKWKNDPKLKLLPPIEASIDPIHACNLLCEHCNAHKYLVEDKKENIFIFKIIY